MQVIFWLFKPELFDRVIFLKRNGQSNKWKEQEEVGIQYLIVDLEPSRELEALDVFANKVIKKVSW